MKYNRLLLLLLFSLPVWANQTPEWYWGGFATQVVSATDANHFISSGKEGITAGMHEVGFYSTWRPASNFHLSGQVISRKAGNVDDGSIKLDYLLADFSLSESTAAQYGLRIGKIKIPYGFYNDTRDVSFTRPSIILPQSLYFDQARDLELSADGALFYAHIPISDMRLDIDLLLGQPKKDKNVEFAYLSDDLSGRFIDSLGFMSRAVLLDDSERWKVGLTLGAINLAYRVGAANEFGLTSGDMKIGVAVLGGEYNTENWTFTAEYMMQRVDWSELGGIFSLDPTNDFESYYAQVKYRMSPTVDLIARYDVLYLDTDDRNGLKTQALFGKPAFSQWAKDLTLGVGWQLTSDLSVRMEWHRVFGTAWLPEQDNPDVSATEKNWNLYLMQFGYRF